MAEYKLVIVESPHKARTIQKFLGKGYYVVASVGHIRDLVINDPNNLLGVDIKNGFNPIYTINPDKKRIVSSLKGACAKASFVYLASDPDREGEAISWHLKEVLELKPENYQRLEFHEITYPAIQSAIESPRLIDMNLVSSQETRRILDRILGFKLSGLVKRKIGSPSAGRVQSVVLKLICDKQEEIDNFKEEIYYRVVGNVTINNKTIPFTLVDDDKKEITFSDIDKANLVIESIKNSNIYVDNITLDNKQRSSKPVYTTASMLQDAASILKFSSSKTTKLAQQLYEGCDLGNGEVGLITYMRTDSIRVSPIFINKVKENINENFGEEYVGKAKIFNNTNERVADAHEGIRPTDISITPAMVEEKLSKDLAKLYKLIYNRALASMMSNELYDRIEVMLNANENKLLLVSEKQTFDGFTKVNDKVERKDFGTNVDENSNVILKSIENKESKTTGPRAYTEASLIDTMKKLGIGRPSTYAITIDNLLKKEYVILTKGYFSPTDQGKLTTKKLVESFKDIINVEYTANMETKLDEIAEGNLTRLEALSKFYDDFNALYQKAKVDMEESIPEPEDLGLCPKCGKSLVKRRSKYGSFIACSGYPECKYILNEDSKVGTVCPKCNTGKILLRKGRYGSFYACSNYPKCDYKESKK